MKFAGRCYRAHDPRWAFTPLSGAGAAIRGGRFNRKGDAALYLALDIMTAVLECTQGLSNRLLPVTICEYDVECDSVADLRDDTSRKMHGVVLAELACGWLACQIAGKDAPSWLVADCMKAAGHSGMIVPSFASGATDINFNLVVWSWGPGHPHKVDVFDPSGRLPTNQLSWPASR